MAVSVPKLTFHIPVAASPAKIPTLLQVLSETEEPVAKGPVLDELALERSTETTRFQESRVLAEEELGLIVTSNKALQLTPSATVLLKKRAAVQFDLLHFLFYTAWDKAQPTENVKSWPYRTICNYLWETQSLKIDKEISKTLTQQIDNQAQEDFAEVPGFSSEKLSIGRQSLAGLLVWLRSLQPAVMQDEEFCRRSTCSSELFLLALSRSYELSDATVGMDLLLSPQRRNEICQLCLLDPLHFDRMLDWVIPIYPQFLAQGTRSGSYGRFVRLNRLVGIEDLG
ncbi:MAG TPA: hypothetical protein VH186_22000 [Chloroflexia bacterium]|nr:hypothetical protein [Chloroflexia bacterium]